MRLKPSLLIRIAATMFVCASCTQKVTDAPPTASSTDLWQTANGPIPPHCLVRPWMSWDNFKVYRDHYKISNWRDFLQNPGMYMGSEITSLKPLEASWGDDVVALAAPYELCFQGGVHDGKITKTQSVKVTRKDMIVTSDVCGADGACLRIDYELLEGLTSAQCERLAPHLSGRCHQARLVYITEYSGGSMGADRQAGLFGIFDVEGDQRYIVPLKYFRTKDEGLTYIRDLEVK